MSEQQRKYLDVCEATVIGAALAEPALWLSELHQLRADLFIGANRDLAAELLEQSRLGKPTDPRAVQAWLVERGHDAKLSDLMRLSDYAPASRVSMRAAVRTLQDASKRRAIIDLAQGLLRQAETKGVKTDDILVAGLLGLSDIGAQSAREVRPISKVLREVMDAIDRPVTGAVKTGLGGLDTVTSGFKPAELIVLGARPSMGKTALALGITINAAIMGQTVCVFSFEMSARQVVERILAHTTNIDLARITTHRVGQAEITRLTNAAGTIHKTDIFIADHQIDVASVSRMLKYQHGLGLVIVDYVQLMEAEGTASREQAIAQISRRLKTLAVQMNVPILALSQLNRALEARSCKRPQLSDFRESGALEQDADIALLLWRPGYYDAEADQTAAELIVAKNRNGPTGSVELVWHKHAARFESAKN